MVAGSLLYHHFFKHGFSCVRDNGGFILMVVMSMDFMVVKEVG